MPSASKITLIAGRGGGSTVPEALMTLAGIDFVREEIDWREIYKTGSRLAAINPAGHIPALILKNGEIVTESGAMALLISEWAPEAELAPPVGAKDRAKFLRMLFFITATLYPMWTFDDMPERYVGKDEAAQKMVRKKVGARREELWRALEGMVSKPWALGRKMSALDIFIAVMTRWRPRRDWFAEECPKLHAIAVKADKLPALKEVWARNYPEG